MPATTRGSHGIAALRIPFIPTTTPEQRQTTTKKKSSTATKKLKSAAAKATTGGTKANTSKPRVRKNAAAGNKTTTGRVTKKAATPKTKKAAATKKTGPKTVNQREPSLLDMVVGVKDKIVGAIEGKPGKKAAGTKKIKGTDGKGATRAKK
ncbi:MAG: hypothetical protein Q9213_004433 [Squamulea squamosa]